MARPLPFLLYHELLPVGGSPARPGEGYARYVLDTHVFRDHIRRIRDAGAVGVSIDIGLGEGDGAAANARGGTPGRSVVLTFDDGCASDLLLAAPILNEAGWNATFFVTVRFLGTPGFMTLGQLRQLAEAGFDIGSHGMTHAYLPDLETAAIRAELVDSKAAIEDCTGRPVRHFSCPGGRWSRTVEDVARDAGYTAVCDSRPVGNAAGADRFRLGRFAVTKATSPDDIARIALDGTLGSLRLRAAALSAARAVLGNRTYDRVRERLLERRSNAEG